MRIFATLLCAVGAAMYPGAAAADTWAGSASVYDGNIVLRTKADVDAVRRSLPLDSTAVIVAGRFL